MTIEKERPNSLWLMFAAAYAVALAGAILIGTLASMAAAETYPGNAVQMPLVAILIALALGGAALGLFRRKNFGRLLFLAIAPWGSIALGSAFPQSLWQEDVPYTALLVFAYVPLAFLLARGSTLRLVGTTDGKWLSRGGGFVLACVAAMFLARLAVMASRPSGGRSFFGLNEYVKRLVLCDVPLCNYVIAFIAVSIPTRFRAKNDAQQGAALDRDSAPLDPRQ